MSHLCRLGYAAEDILSTLFRVCKTLEAEEQVRLACIRELARAQLQAADGLASPLQLAALLARCCRAVQDPLGDHGA